MSIGADISPWPDLASWRGVSGRQRRRDAGSVEPSFSQEGLIPCAASTACSWQFSSQPVQGAHTGMLLALPFGSAQPPPNTSTCSAGKRIHPLVKADTATTAPGGIPTEPELARQRPAFPGMPSAGCMRSGDILQLWSPPRPQALQDGEVFPCPLVPVQLLANSFRAKTRR